MGVQPAAHQGGSGPEGLRRARLLEAEHHQRVGLSSALRTAFALVGGVCAALVSVCVCVWLACVANSCMVCMRVCCLCDVCWSLTFVSGFLRQLPLTPWGLVRMEGPYVERSAVRCCIDHCCTPLYLLGQTHVRCTLAWSLR